MAPKIAEEETRKARRAEERFSRDMNIMCLFMKALEITIANGFLLPIEVCTCSCLCGSLLESLSPECSPSVQVLFNNELKKRSISLPPNISPLIAKKVLTTFNGFIPTRSSSSSNSSSFRKITINENEVLGCYMTPLNTYMLVLERESFRETKNESAVAYLIDTCTLQKIYIDDEPFVEHSRLHIKDIHGQEKRPLYIMDVVKALHELYGVKWISETQFVGLSKRPLAGEHKETNSSQNQPVSLFFNEIMVQMSHGKPEMMLMAVSELAVEPSHRLSASINVSNIEPIQALPGQYIALNTLTRESVYIDVFSGQLVHTLADALCHSCCKLNNHMVLRAFGGRRSSYVHLEAVGGHMGDFRIDHQFLNSVKTNGNGYSFYITAARSNCVEEYDVRRLSSNSPFRGFSEDSFEEILKCLPTSERKCKWLYGHVPTKPVMNYGIGPKSSRVIDFAVARDGRVITRQTSGKTNFKVSIHGYIPGKILDPYVIIPFAQSKVYDASQAWAITKDLVTDGAVDNTEVENTIWFCSGQNKNAILVHENQWKLSFMETSSCVVDVERDLYDVLSLD